MGSTSHSMISISVVLFISLYIKVGANITDSENTYSQEDDLVPVLQSSYSQFLKTGILPESRSIVEPTIWGTISFMDLVASGVFAPLLFMYHTIVNITITLLKLYILLIAVGLLL